MDSCLQCGRRIPVQMSLQGESRVCCPNHRLAFQNARQEVEGRVHLLDIPEPGREWAVTYRNLDSSLLADLQPASCGVLRMTGGPRVPQLQRLPWKYEMVFPKVPSMADPVWGCESLVNASENTACGGPRLKRRPVEPLPRRQDRLARYSWVLGLLRMTECMKVAGAKDMPVRMRKPKQMASPQYRNVGGFPIYHTGEGEPALSGLVKHPALQWAAREAWSVRMIGATAEQFVQLPVKPRVRIHTSLAPEAATAIDTSAQGSCFGPVETNVVHVKSLEIAGMIPLGLTMQLPAAAISTVEPWGLQSSFVPSMGAVKELAESLRSVSSQLRDRREEVGLHVPQSMMQPLRPRVLAAEPASGGSEASERESGVVSIESRRAAMGSRR